MTAAPDNRQQRFEMYIGGHRIALRLNGYVAGLVADHGHGIRQPAVAALRAFFLCEEEEIVPRLDAFVAAHHGTSRSWLIEHLLAVRLGP